MSAKQVVRRGFSLIELVIVVVIIGIIAAIAVPRLSRGATAAADSSLIGNLQVLRNAVDLYQTEHQGTYPTDGTTVEAQLTLFSDDAGATKPASDSTHYFGPYLRAVPPLPVGAKKGGNKIAAADGASVGWIYDATTHNISANTTAGEVDAKGKLYSSY